jgi:hypothetical protein
VIGEFNFHQKTFFPPQEPAWNEGSSKAHGK